MSHPTPPAPAPPPGGRSSLVEHLAWQVTEPQPAQPPPLPGAAGLFAGRDVDQRPAAAPAPGAGGFRVEPDGAGAVIARLDEALHRLTGTLRTLQGHGRIEPPAADHVSGRIAQNVGQMFDNAHEYVRVLRDQVEATRNALQAQFDSYRRVDDPRTFRS